MKKICNFSGKVVAILVAISVILSSVAVSTVFVAKAGNSDDSVQTQVWSGKIANAYAGGKGTDSEPFLIENGEQLARLVNDANTAGKYYKITQDIYLNDTTTDNWKDTANQWYAYNKSAEFPGYFSGTLDGDNHKIIGFYLNCDKYYAGLFVAIKNAVIKNLSIAESYIKSSSTTGTISVFAGYIGGAVSYNRCVIDDTVTVIGGHASGFASYGSGNVSIDSCASYADISGAAYTAAFIADVWSSTLKISNSIGIEKLSPKRAITSTNNYSTVADTYGTFVVTALQMKGETAKENMPNLNWQRVWKTTDGYPTINVITGESAPGELWTGKVATKYAGGDGTKENPFLISNGEQLARLNFDTDTEGKFYKLTHDIILNDSTLSNWKNYAVNWVTDTASATFKGTLLGEGHTVKGLYYNGTSARASLLKNTSGNVKISRLVLDGVYIKTSGYGPAAFVGNSDGTLQFVECYVTNSSITSTYNSSGDKGAGGFVGYGTAAVEIEDSAYIGTVTAPDFAGAFIGHCWTIGVHSVKNSFTNADIPFCKKRTINTNSANNYGVNDSLIQPGVTIIADSQMKGTAAIDNMPNLDWGRTWKINKNGYPLPVFPSSEGTVGEVWTGNTATDYAGGDGSEANPYLIATGEQLLRLVKDTDTNGKFYKIIADIKLNDTSVDNWKKYARQWPWQNNSFNGTLDGDGHTISGLYYNGTSSKIGLFSYANDATIKRLIINKFSVTSSGYGVSLLVGQASGTVKFVEVYADETNTVKSTYSSTNDKSAGGFVGYGGGTVTIEDSAFLGTVEGTAQYGAFLGNLWATPLIKNSFSSAKLKLSGRWALSTDSVNNYSAGDIAENGVVLVSSDKMLGLNAKTNMPNLDWGRTWKVIESGYPLPLFPNPNGVAGEVWTGNTAVKYNGGDGTKDNPYQIATAEQLLKMVLDTDSQGVYYKQVYDIKLNDTSASDWKDSARNWIWNNNIFKGNFDGAGHTISGLYYNGSKSKVALFCYAANATFQNILIKNSYISTTGYAAGTLVGDANSGKINISKCYIENGYVESTFDADNNKGAGGIVGYGAAAITVKGAAFIGEVKAPANAGAILGNCWSSKVNDKKQNVSQNTVSNSFSNAEIKFCSKQALNNKSDNNYSTFTGTESNVISIAEDKIIGASAQENMAGLDWKKIWKTTESFPVLNFDAVEDGTGNYWTGDTAESFASGTGTENDPYIITNGEELALMVLDTESKGKFYKLANNIKLNDTSLENWIYGANQWVWTDNVFEGTFDGAGKTIDGLYYNGAKSKIGLFSYTKNATVKNVEFTNSYLKSAGYGVGTVIGDANSGTAELYQCYVKNGYVESTFNGDSNKGAGGLIGYGSAAITVNGSAYFGKVIAPENVGAILGNCWGKDANGKSALVVKQSIGGAGLKLCTKQDISSISDNNYSNCETKENNVTYISSDKMQGADAMKNMPALDWGTLWKTTSAYLICRFGDVVSVAKDVWSGNVADAYAGGDGTENNPYLIKNGEQLALLALDTETEGKYYKLTNDIKLNDTSSSDWTYYAKQWVWSDAVFKGYFDADTKTISGLYFESTKSKVGLFCYTKNATLKRIVLDNAYVHSSGYATGTLVGDANSGTLIISECYVKENSSVKSTFDADNNTGAGGFVGYGGATIQIDGSAYLGTVSAPKFAGALLGNCWTSAVITNSFAVPEMKFCSKRAIASDSANNYGTGKEAEKGVFSIKLLQMKGAAAKINMPLLNWVRSWKTSSGFPLLNVGEYEGIKGAVWSGRLAKNFAGGSGTKNDPYLIATGEQLAKLVANVLDAKGKYYKLVADIYLNDISKPDWEKTANQWFWVSTARKGNFNGHFNGDGHVIYGMYLNMDPTNSVVYAGLFPTISDGTVIEKTGLSDCHLIVENNDVDKQAYVGGFAGVVFYNQADEETDLNNLPVISQCFGDTKVILEGRYAGGIVGGGARTANIDNSYFVGEVIGERVGAIIGNTWTTFEGTTITKCYSATNAADIFSGGRAGVQNSSTPIGFKDNYSNATGLASFVTQLSLLMMRGESAKKNMPALDFENIWYALDNGTPVLRIFGTTDKFSNTKDPKLIEVSFVTNGGSKCKSIFGNPEEKLKLPTPKRKGYKFDGWYVYKELDIPYSIDYFPYFDTILYAKWSPLGVIQDFENYTNSPYDYGEDYEYYRPGAVGYDAEYVKSGMASMHRIGETDSQEDFLINYMDMLEIGTDYSITFWVTTDTDKAKADISIVHEDFPDVFDTDSGVVKITTLKGMKQGEWKEVEATFTAKTKWLAIRTSGNASLYFEDIMIIPTSDGVNAVSNMSVTVSLVVYIGVAVIVLAGVVTTTVLIIKKRKTKV